MLKLARSIVLKPARSFHLFNKLSKDVRGIIINMLIKIDKNAAANVCVDFFNSVYSKHNTKSLIKLLFNSRVLSRSQRYQIYKLINSALAVKESSYNVYIEFEYSIVNDSRSSFILSDDKYKHTEFNIDYIVGLINFISVRELSHNYSRTMIYEQLNVVNTNENYKWINKLSVTADELFDIIDKKCDITKCEKWGGNFSFHMKKYRGQPNKYPCIDDMENFDFSSRILKKEELYQYASRNLHLGYMSKQRLMIHYYYKIPISLANFMICSMLCNFYLFKEYNIIGQQFINSFMEDDINVSNNKLPFIFDKPLSRKCISMLILTKFGDLIGKLPSLYVNCTVYNKLVEISEHFIVYFPGYTCAWICDPVDINFKTNLNNKLKSDWNSNKYIPIINSIITYFYRDVVKFNEILLHISGTDRYFKHIISSINDNGTIILNKLCIDGIKLINKLIKLNRSNNKINLWLANIIYEIDIKKHNNKLVDKLNCNELINLFKLKLIDDRITNINKIYHNNSPWAGNNLENVNKILKELSNEEIDGMLKFILTKPKTDKYVFVFNILVEHYYNESDDRIIRYNNILAEFD